MIADYSNIFAQLIGQLTNELEIDGFNATRLNAGAYSRYGVNVFSQSESLSIKSESRRELLNEICGKKMYKFFNILNFCID